MAAPPAAPCQTQFPLSPPAQAGDAATSPASFLLAVRVNPKRDWAVLVGRISNPSGPTDRRSVLQSAWPHFKAIVYCGGRGLTIVSSLRSDPAPFYPHFRHVRLTPKTRGPSKGRKLLSSLSNPAKLADRLDRLERSATPVNG